MKYPDITLIPAEAILPFKEKYKLQNLYSDLSPGIDIFEGIRRLATIPFPKSTATDVKMEQIYLTLTHNAETLEVDVKETVSDLHHLYNIPLSGRDQVNCTIFSPTEVVPEDMFLVQAVIHLPELEKEVKTIADGVDPEAKKRASKSLISKIARNSLLSFHLVLSGMEIEDGIQEMVWLGKKTSVQFSVRVPKNHTEKVVVGAVNINQDNIPLGQIKFNIKVISIKDKRNENPELVGEAIPFNIFFISYDSKDRTEVLKRVQMLHLLGKRFYQDLLNLDPGVRWERELYKLIDKSDAVLLFWSTNAKNSELVMRECSYTIQTKGINYLIPVVIEGPPPVEPPPALSEMHMNDRLLYFMHQ